MSSWSPDGTGLMSVSVVAGPSAPELLAHLASTQTRLQIKVLAAADLGGDPARIVDQIKAIARAKTIDHLILQSDPETPVMAYASLFVSPQEGGPLAEVAQLNGTAVVIKSATLVSALLGRDSVADSVSPCFLAEQIEFAGDIVLDGDVALARDIASTLNPRARVWTLSRTQLERWLADAGHSFDFLAALEGGGWRQLIDGQDSPEPGDANINAFAYRARRPFHPERFWHFLQDGVSGVFRAKGFFWLATRTDLVGGLNLAGSEMHCASAGQWWAARDERMRESEMPDRTRQQWIEPFGDRRQAIAFMTHNADQALLMAKLDACLLTETEMVAGEEHWRTLADPFPDWSSPQHHHHCDHDHDHHHHDDGHGNCCHD
jgi:G3E family GTPase